MKLNYLFLLFVTALILNSCNRNADPDESLFNKDLITSAKYGGIYPDLNIINPHEIEFNFEYNSKKNLIKKTGGFIGVNVAAGFNASFTKQVYTSLIYNGDVVTVENFSSASEFTVPKNTIIFNVDATNQILFKEIPSLNPYGLKKEIYIYKNGLLDEIKTTFPNIPYDPTDPNDYISTLSEKFYYDVSGNMIRSELHDQEDGVNVAKLIFRYFENYDTSFNPFKKFALLDEFFYRSLSKNNFRTYRVEKTENGYTNVSQQDWDFQYDNNGRIIIN